MQAQHRHNQFIALCLGVALFAFASLASADPPTRVARLGYISGAVSFSPAGENDWVRATVNRPLINGDRLWADAGARSELQVGSAAIRMNGRTSVTVLNLDDNVVQLQLGQGTLNLHVRRFDPDDVLEVDTPNLAFSIRQPGDYRIDVDSSSDATTVITLSGRAEVYGEGAAYVVDAQKSYRFYGTGLRDYDVLGLPPPDDFDRWAYDRDRRWERSITSRYVSPDVIGYQDLDDYGAWQADEMYGNVWVPSQVYAGWTPYYAGHWAWIEPWGWTWVDDAPWGFTVSHYGRWADRHGTWCWVPGPVRTRAVYAPALVAFVGGRNFQLSISVGSVAGVAWFPLGPRDVYRPTYAVSHDYFYNVNRSNTVINNTQITNVYNNTNVTNITYVNQNVKGAVVAVPATAFAQSQPVSKAAVRVSKDAVAREPVTQVAAVAPVKASVVGAAAPASNKPPAAILERPVVAKRTPPAAPVSFANKEHLLSTNPGKPLGAEALEALKPAAPAAAAKVQVVAPEQSAKPVTAPPPGQHGKSQQRGRPVEQPVTAPVTSPESPVVTPSEQRAQPTAPGAQPQMAKPPEVAAPPEQRGKPQQRGKPAESPVATPITPPGSPVVTPSEQRGQPTIPGVQPPMATPSEVAAPPEPRGKSQQRGRPVEPPVATPITPSESPVAAPPEQRGKPAPRAQPTAPGVQPQMDTSPELTAPPESRGKPQQRGRPMEPPIATPMTPSESPVAAPPEQRGKSAPRVQPTAPSDQPQMATPPEVTVPSEQRRRYQQRGRPMEPPVATPMTPPASPVAAPPEQRGNSAPRVQPMIPGVQPQRSVPPEAAPQPGSRDNDSKANAAKRKRIEQQRLEEQRKLDEERNKPNP